MLVAITGTPGTGKSSAADLLDRRGYYVVYLDRLAEEKHLITGVDELRGSREVDIDRLDQEVHAPVKLGFVVSHYSHLLSVDLAIVLRCHPRVLADRLRGRGWPDRKVRENVEAEAIDVITQEAVGRLHHVFEVDTTHARADETATTILAVLQGRTQGHEPGSVDWTSEVLSWY